MVRRVGCPPSGLRVKASSIIAGAGEHAHDASVTISPFWNCPTGIVTLEAGILPPRGHISRVSTGRRGGGSLEGVCFFPLLFGCVFVLCDGAVVTGEGCKASWHAVAGRHPPSRRRAYAPASSSCFHSTFSLPCAPVAHRDLYRGGSSHCNSWYQKSASAYPHYVSYPLPHCLVGQL